MFFRVTWNFRNEQEAYKVIPGTSPSFISDEHELQTICQRE